jgi:2-polyprenyl-3-methyl-5-hydroxy-6-metoxy-1,4-benzoquinol methylase
MAVSNRRLPMAIPIAEDQEGAGGIERLYASKKVHYFAGSRPDMVALLPTNPAAAVLEVGCAQGRTGALALESGKCASYCAVELNDDAASIASRRLTEVVVGDIEKVGLPWKPASFDALLISEVLEHLVDPWAALRRLRPLMKPGALVLASSPNAAHYAMILMLLRGQWLTTDVGPMDRTHLRWFTPRSYRRMFESCGFVVDDVTSVAPHGWKARALLRVSCGKWFHLLTRQIMLRGYATECVNRSS